MGIEFTVYKGSKTGTIVEATGYREPGPTEVLVKISHCGVCGTDEHFRHVDMGLGHEGIGTITELGSAVENVSDFKVGDRVGMGYFQKFCGYCQQCLSGHQNYCATSSSLGTANLDQGCFGTGIAWDVSALVKVPDEIASEDAGPLMCGGATVWSPLHDYGLKAGDRVGIIGIGGLGHMAIQFASKMGMEAVVFSSTDLKRQQALDFGASQFVATRGRDRLDGVDKLNALLITTSANPNLSMFLPLLAPGARVFPLTVSTESLDLSPMALISSGINVIGSGTAPLASIRSMLSFTARNNVRPQIEKFPMSQGGITAAMQKLAEGKMRYRGVLVAP